MIYRVCLFFMCLSLYGLFQEGKTTRWAALYDFTLDGRNSDCEIKTISRNYAVLVINGEFYRTCDDEVCRSYEGAGFHLNHQMKRKEFEGQLIQGGLMPPECDYEASFVTNFYEGKLAGQKKEDLFLGNWTKEYRFKEGILTHTPVSICFKGDRGFFALGVFNPLKINMTQKDFDHYMEPN